MGLVLPTDNAVIDYSIINQIIAAVNQHQGVINQIQQVTSQSTSTSTGTISITKTVGGVLKSTTATKTFTLNLPTGGIASLISVTATPYSTGAAAYCWISSVNSSRVIFSTNIAVTAIYYTATGTT